MAIYMKYAAIDGESTTEGYAKWIEIESFQLGVGRGIGSARGTSTRESSEASVSEISVTKKSDNTSVPLIEEALYGKLNNKVEIVFTRTKAGGSGVQPYLEYELNGCGVAGFSISSGGERPMESISLNFDKIQMKYLLVGDELAGTPKTTLYDLSTAKNA